MGFISGIDMFVPAVELLVQPLLSLVEALHTCTFRHSLQQSPVALQLTCFSIYPFQGHSLQGYNFIRHIGRSTINVKILIDLE
jgi:hypothetical protein